MKAYSLLSIGNLEYGEVEIPDIKSGWCLIKVKACGICSSDIPRIYKKGTYHFPTIPGHEFSGIVLKVGNSMDACWIGKRVGVFPLIPCKQCEFCKKHKYEMCKSYDYIGSRRDGAYAEYVAAPIWNLIGLPDNISYKEAAMLEPLSVALHATKTAGVIKGNSVAIVGTGMIGFAVAQWCNIFGAKNTFIIGRNTSKKIYADKIGVNYIDGNTNDILDKFDVVFEAVGTNNAINTAIKIAKSGGKVVMLGNPEGDILFEQNIYWEILRKQLSVFGTWNSSFEHTGESDWKEAVEAISSKRISVENLISHCYPNEKLKSALDIMRNHKEPYCKVMIDWK